MDRTQAALVTYKYPDIMEEAVSLADAAGYQVVELVTIRDQPHGKFGVGEGKADALRDLAHDGKIQRVIIDDKVSAAENFNLSEHCGCDVVDREKLVLEIFAKRAVTEEAKLQVKLAELSYELPRVRQHVKLRKLGEQPGMFGYGSYEVEKYYRSIKVRMDATRSKLSRIESRRDLFRRHRRQQNFSTISLAGYTSSGKSTLFNTLTGSDQPVSSKLFSTLSTTTRMWELPQTKALLSDTVGFISRLPHYMVEAFKSTLEELRYADLVVLLVDVSEPPDRVSVKYETCLRTMSDLNVRESSVLTVFNKVDKTRREEALRMIGQVVRGSEAPLLISAKDGTGLDDLRSRVSQILLREKPAEEAVEEPVTQREVPRTVSDDA